MKRKRRHTILAFAHNRPGVLYKRLSLVRQKRYDVESAITLFEEFGILGIARTGATVMHREEEQMGLDRIVLPGISAHRTS